MDTGIEPAMCVHRKDGTVMKFVEHPSGLYVFDTSKAPISESVNAYTFVSSVAANKQMFTRREVEAADAARALYRKIGRPSQADFLHILSKNLIRNCPVTPDDAKRALVIYGPDIAALKGKNTRSAAAPHVPTFQAVPIPAHVYEHHRDLTLCMDFFFVQGIPFLHSISRKLGFRTLTQVPNRLKNTILRETRSIVRLYHARGLNVCDIHADNEFECIREHIRPIDLDIVPADSHVGEVERSIRSLKERIRSTVHGLPFKRLPKLMVTEITKHSVQCLNRFPWKNGVSRDMSPHTIVTGKPAPDYNKMKIEFGSYAQVSEETTNTTKARTLGAIALTDTGNANGDYYFMSLATGARISRHEWTELPITDTAIARVEAIAANEGQPLVQERGLVVEWRPGQDIDDDEYDRDYVPVSEQDEEEEQQEEYEPIEEQEIADLNDDADNGYNEPGGNEEQHGYEQPDDDEQEQEEHAEVSNDEDADEENENNESENDEQPMPPHEDEGAPPPDEDQGATMHDEQGAMHGEQEGAHPNEDQGAQEGAAQPPTVETVNEHDEDDEEGGDGDQSTEGYNLRDRKERGRNFAEAMDEPHSGKSYYPPHQFVQAEVPIADMSKTDRERFVFGFVMTQMSAKAGIKKHGRKAEEALMAEFAQLEDLSVFEAIDPTTLTSDQRKGALRSINLIKEKRCGRLKGRAVADGRPQRKLYDKSETSSPTVSTDALMLSLMIDAKEGRDVATADVAGAYLKAEMDDFVVMKLIGQDVEIFCEMNRAYEPYVVTEHGKKVLYVRLLKALYGCVKSALLWYELFTEHLKEKGFVLNPYDPCVANCMVDGKQCTLAWYVDDNKVSHVDTDVVTGIIEMIEERFGKMTVTRGKRHTFLGMDIFFPGDGTVQITMADYLKEAIAESGLDIRRTVATPATRNLFDVTEPAQLLTQDQAEIFHSVVSKLLYVSIRARGDMLLPVIFLCTRIRAPTTEDQRKLKRVLEYINVRA